MSERILHIFDEAIIGRSSIELLNQLSFPLTHVVLTGSPERWREYEAVTDNVFVLDFNRGKVVPELEQLIGEHDIIFAEALSYEKAKAICKSRGRDKVFVWSCWGYGLYNVLDYYQGSDASYSTTMSKEKGFFGRLLGAIRDYYTFRLVYKEAVRKIDICLFTLESDYHLLGSVLEHDAEWMGGCYTTTKTALGDREDFRVEGDGILVGNSSTPSNRHSLAFDILSKSELGQRKILVPLSYGDASYRESVVGQGRTLFSGQFSPITEFMPLQEYLDMVECSSHVIMAHERQQAFGTIVLMLLGGAKLFLSEKSPFLKWFRALGLHVYSLEQDLIREIRTKLSETKQIENRRIMEDCFSEESVLRSIERVHIRAVEIWKERRSHHV